jgi:hypothetical protein
MAAQSHAPVLTAEPILNGDDTGADLSGLNQEERDAPW